jgi:hypothetical protein
VQPSPDEDPSPYPETIGQSQSEQPLGGADDFAEGDFAGATHIADAIADDAMTAAEYEDEFVETTPTEVVTTEMGLDEGYAGDDSAGEDFGGDDEAVAVDEFVITSGLDAGNDFDLSDVEFDESDIVEED